MQLSSFKRDTFEIVVLSIPLLRSSNSVYSAALLPTCRPYRTFYSSVF